MNEPHQIIEKEYLWDDFYPILFSENIAVKIHDRFYGNDRFRYCLRNDEEKIIFYNGAVRVVSFLKKFNTTVEYGHGVFYPMQQIFDSVETDEMEEVWLMDGMVENRPVIKELETYKLIRRPLEIYQLRKF